MPAGEYRGWADRLALLLALASPADAPVEYANLAVRSRKVADAIEDQLPSAVALGADLVSVLIGANDLVGRRADAAELATRLGEAVLEVRGTGADVLLVTPFMSTSLARMPRRTPLLGWDRSPDGPPPSGVP